MEKETIQQVENIVSFFDRELKDAKHNEKVNVACVLNRLEDRGNKWNWKKRNPGFMDAVEKIKRELKIKGTSYELYRDNPLN